MATNIRIFPDLPHRLTVDQCAEATGQGRRTIDRWIAEGRLPAYRIGKKVIVLRPDLEAACRPVRGAK